MFGSVFAMRCASAHGRYSIRPEWPARFAISTTTSWTKPCPGPGISRRSGGTWKVRAELGREQAQLFRSRRSDRSERRCREEEENLHVGLTSIKSERAEHPVQRDDRNQRDQRERDRDHEDVGVGLEVGQAADREQRDDGAVVRQRVEAAGGKRRDAVQELGQMPAACPALEVLAPSVCSAMLMPPDAEPVMPASTLTATASETSGLPGAIEHRVAQDREPGSEAITPP